jgi:hypothetical protein
MTPANQESCIEGVITTYTITGNSKRNLASIRAGACLFSLGIARTSEMFCCVDGMCHLFSRGEDDGRQVIQPGKGGPKKAHRAVTFQQTTRQGRLANLRVSNGTAICD